jgi:hypothetical protein
MARRQNASTSPHVMRRRDDEETTTMGNQQKGPSPQRPQGTPGTQQGQQNVYGEGNYQATRDYNERTKQFIDSVRVDQAARDAAPDSEAEALQMAAAEAEGKRHAKGEDPALSRKARPSDQAGDSDTSGRGPEDTSTPKPGQEA